MQQFYNWDIHKTILSGVKRWYLCFTVQVFDSNLRHMCVLGPDTADRPLQMCQNKFRTMVLQLAEESTNDCCSKRRTNTPDNSYSDLHKNM